MNPEQGFDLPAQGGVTRAGLIQIGAALTGGQFQSCGKNGNFRVGRFVHGNLIIHPLIRENETKRAKNSEDLKMIKNVGHMRRRHAVRGSVSSSAAAFAACQAIETTGQKGGAAGSARQGIARGTAALPPQTLAIQKREQAPALQNGPPRGGRLPQAELAIAGAAVAAGLVAGKGVGARPGTGIVAAAAAAGAALAGRLAVFGRSRVVAARVTAGGLMAGFDADRAAVAQVGVIAGAAPLPVATDAAVSEQNVPVQQTGAVLAKSDCQGIPQPERNISSSPLHGRVVRFLAVEGTTAGGGAWVEVDLAIRDGEGVGLAVVTGQGHRRRWSRRRCIACPGCN